MRQDSTSKHKANELACSSEFQWQAELIWARCKTYKRWWNRLLMSPNGSISNISGWNFVDPVPCHLMGPYRTLRAESGGPDSRCHQMGPYQTLQAETWWTLFEMSLNGSISNITGWNLVSPVPDVTKWVHSKHYGLKRGGPDSRCHPMGPYQTLKAETW